MRLKELRQQRGMVRTELAKEIETTVRSISRWEMVRPICYWAQPFSWLSFLK